MVDEVFLQNAIRIRRTYLKMTNNMELYQNKAKEIVGRLDDTLIKIDNLQKLAQESKKNSNVGSQGLLTELLGILNDIDIEGKSLEDLVNPLNQEIEKLAIEEQELYRQIKEKHYDLTDEQIIQSVKDRLNKENLS